MNRVERVFTNFIEQITKVIKGEKDFRNERENKRRHPEELKTAFLLLDKNQDGRISVSEFQHMLKNFGIDVPDKVIAALIKQASATGECLLNEKEFLEWIGSFLSETPEDVTEDLIAAFQVFDKDQNGYITKDELKVAMDMIGEQVTDQELNGMIELADIDRDGRINYEEFAKLLL